VLIEFLFSMYTVKNNYSISQKCSDHLTTFLHNRYSPVCAVNDPPASDYSLHNYFATTTCWFHTHCCLLTC